MRLDDRTRESSVKTRTEALSKSDETLETKERILRGRSNLIRALESRPESPTAAGVSTLGNFSQDVGLLFPVSCSHRILSTI